MALPNRMIKKICKKNVVDDLEQTRVNGHQDQQLQQQTNDRRHQDALNHKGT